MAVVRRSVICGIIYCLLLVHNSGPLAFAQGRMHTPQAREFIDRARLKIQQRSKEDARKATEKQWERERTGVLSAEGGTVSEREVFAVEYFIAVGDEMEIFVWQNPDLTKNVIVGPDGKISYPLVGRIQAAGLGIGQLEIKIKEELSKYVQYPEVSIMMKKFTGDKIIVLGEIEYPGIYTYQGMIDLIGAIALAGDFTDDARGDSVIVVRGSLSPQPQVRRVNALGVMSKGIPQENIVLRPNDTVYVPRTFIGNINKFLTQTISPLINRTKEYLDMRKEIRYLQWYER